MATAKAVSGEVNAAAPASLTVAIVIIRLNVTATNLLFHNKFLLFYSCYFMVTVHSVCAQQLSTRQGAINAVTDDPGLPVHQHLHR